MSSTVWVSAGTLDELKQAIYHDRFLNVPRAPKPKPAVGRSFDPEDLLELMDRRQQVDETANWVAGYLGEGRDPQVLLGTLGLCLLREDADFHTFQLYEAAAAEYDHWDSRSDSFSMQAKETCLIACARYLAAHAPSARELPHTAKIAWRLYRGERLLRKKSRIDPPIKVFVLRPMKHRTLYRRVNVLDMEDAKNGSRG